MGILTWYVPCGPYRRQLVLVHDTDVKGRVPDLKRHKAYLSSFTVYLKDNNFRRY